MVAAKSMRETSRPDLPELLLAEHGGNLFAARKAYPQAPEPWLDLSTGINPYAYPFAHPPMESFTRLPQPDELRALEAAAATAYRAPAAAEVVAAPGSQAIVNWLPRLLPARRVGILGFTYGEHARSWAANGAELTVVEDLCGLEDKDIAIVVNPNNPDGRLVAAADLHALAAVLCKHGGLLIIDEAFVDFLEPGASAVPDIRRKRRRRVALLRQDLWLAGASPRVRDRVKTRGGKTPLRVGSLAGLRRGHRHGLHGLDGRSLARGDAGAIARRRKRARQNIGGGRFRPGWRQPALSARAARGRAILVRTAGESRNSGTPLRGAAGLAALWDSWLGRRQGAPPQSAWT